MKPILFSTKMVCAILGNRKAVTRRVVKPQPPATAHVAKIRYSWCWSWWEDSDSHKLKPPYCPGDILYVRETWQYAYDLDGNEQPIEGTGRYLYAADVSTEPFGFWVNPDGTHRDSMPWRPSIHMPREAARIFLRVTDVRLEQLFYITGKQAKAEGFISRDSFLRNFFTMYPDCSPKSWVWVIEFERISKEETE